MDQQQSQHSIDTRVNSQLAEFLHELNLARRSLTLYPVEHPQVAATSRSALERLQKLLDDRTEITLGVAPEALFFDDDWLDLKNTIFRDFARFLSSLGLVSVSFKRKIDGTELIRFCQLLRSSRDTLEDLGGFEQLMEQNEIIHIEVIPIDYDIFRAKNEPLTDSEALSTDLWKDFLHGLLEDLLDMGSCGLRIAPRSIAELLNKKLFNDNEADLHSGVVDEFIEQLLNSPRFLEHAEPGEQLNELLQHLSPQLQISFLAGTLQALDKDPEIAGQALKAFTPDLLRKACDPRLQQDLNSSSHLIDLIDKLTFSQQHSNPGSSAAVASMDRATVRARLDVLFSEEQYDLYLPNPYQAALQNIYNVEPDEPLPDELVKELRREAANQPIEQQCCAIIFELLNHPEQIEDDEALQDHLHDLSGFFLDTGNFAALNQIYLNWSAYLNSGQSEINLLQEKVLAGHCRQEFVREVVEGLDIWGEQNADIIREYIINVGAPYTEQVVEQLGREKQYKRRRFWMEVLEAIGADAHELLLEALKDERWYLVRNLLIVLGKDLTPTNIKEIFKLTGHQHPKVRHEAIKILYQHNAATADRLLLKELTSKRDEIRFNAVKIAALSRNETIINHLHQELQSPTDSDAKLKYQRQVLTTLAQIDSSSSLELLGRLVRKKMLFASKLQKQLQLDIIRSLGKYSATEAAELLRNLAGSRNKLHATLASEQLRQRGASR